MAERSFTNYIAATFYNELFEYVENYVLENYDALDLKLRNVEKISEISLEDITVKWTHVSDLPGMKIGFDVTLEAELHVSETHRHGDEFDICMEWFILQGTGDLACDLKDFEIHDIEIHRKKGKRSAPMSDALVPFIKKENLDEVAHDFLKRNYPEALKDSTAFKPEELVHRMGLTLDQKNITDDFSIFGQVYFKDSEATFYDAESGEMVTEAVKEGTIIVDPDAYFLRNLGAVNNTIVHECVHWDLHRKAFALERLYNNSVNKIQCQVVGGIKGTEMKERDWMEWQANSLAPKIQMPLGKFKKSAFEYIKKFKEEMHTSEIIDVIEPVIRALEVEFAVSRTAAKIRMIDAGYEEAMGAFTYIDGRYIKPHRFKKGALKGNQTFSIGVKDAAFQSFANSLLREQIRDGSYLFVDSHFVLNHPDFVTTDLFGKMELTNYARTHMDECCLIFDLSVTSDFTERYHSECFLNRDETSNISFEIVYSGGYENSTPEKQKELLLKELKDTNDMYGKLTTNYCNCLQLVRKWKGVTFRELGERTLIHERTIRRIFNGETEGSLNNLVAICLALHLPPKISGHIIDHSPHSLNLNKTDHQWYEFALTHFYPKSMDEIRSFLTEQGAEAV